MTLLTLLADVLMVGHSLVGPALPGLVETALRGQGAPAEVVAQVTNGAPLGWNWDYAAAAEGVDGRALLASGGVGHLILTEAQPLADHLAHSDSTGRVAQWAGAAWAADPAAQVWIYETWPDRDTAALPWPEAIAADRPGWQALVAAAEALRPATAPPVRLIPAGAAMARLAAAAEAGAVPGVSGIGDFFDDGIHPNGRGLTFVAYVHAAALTGRPVDGLPARLFRAWPSRDGVVTAEMAAALQRIAWETVADELAAPPSPPPPPPPEVEVEATTAPPPPAAPAAPAAAATAPVARPHPAAPPPAAAIAALPGIRNPALALNLAPVADWEVQQPFLDVIKTARPWIAHRPGQWGGWEFADLVAQGHVTPDGWPRSLPEGATGLSTVVLTDLPAEAVQAAGRYVLEWAGGATVRVEGRATGVEAAPGRIAFDFTPGPGAVVVTLTALDRAAPLTAMTLVRQDRLAAFRAGALFNPDWTARLQGVSLLRFMDWGAVNDSRLAGVAERPLPGDFTWARAGVPVEIMVRLANELGAEPWICVPHQADDALVTAMAASARDGLDPGLRVWVEYSNEVWNWQFAQAAWADAQARARWGAEDAWMQFYGLRAAEVMGLWAAAFGETAKARLVRVMGVQTGWPGLEAQVLDAPLAVAEGRRAPAEAFDAYAVTGYFAALLGTPDKAPLVRGWLQDSEAAARAAAAAAGLAGAGEAAFVAEHRHDLATGRAAAELADGSVSGQTDDTLAALLGTVLPYHAGVARVAGLRLVMYEGGTHVVGLGPVLDDPALGDFFRHLNYSPEMAALYGRLLDGWAALSDAPFAAFNDVQAPSKWGSWGALRHLGDDNPRWRALAGRCPSC
jgi:hypothetical protein